MLQIAEPPEPCPRCAGPMRVQKTQSRCAQTLAHGRFEARQTVYVCAAGCRWPSGAHVTQRAGSLAAALVLHAVVGYDVMVFVGLQRFVHHRQRKEIQATLHEAHGLTFSTGELRALFRRTKVRPKLRELIRSLGREIGADIDAAREAVRRWQHLGEAGQRIPPGHEGLAIVRALAQWALDAKLSSLSRLFSRCKVDPVVKTTYR